MIAALLLVTQIALYFNDVTADYPCKVNITETRFSEPPINLTVTWSPANDSKCLEAFDIYIRAKNLATSSKNEIQPLRKTLYCNKLTLTHLQPNKFYYSVGIVQHLNESEELTLPLTFSEIVWSDLTKKQNHTAINKGQQIGLKLDDTCISRELGPSVDGTKVKTSKVFVIATIVLSICVLVLLAVVLVKYLSPNQNFAEPTELAEESSVVYYSVPKHNTANDLYSRGSSHYDTPM